MGEGRSTICYDPDAWRAARLLIENYGPASAIVVAHELCTGMALQADGCADFWRLIAEVVADWHRPFPRDDETVH